MSKKRVATIGFTHLAETNDVDALETIIAQRWNYETEVNLENGSINVWRDDDG